MTVGRVGFRPAIDAAMGAILARLQNLHHAACLKARPDPADLARRLFEWEIACPWDTFYGGAETYADVLGETGLATNREMARARWDRMPPLGRGDKGRYETPRFRLTSIMGSLAKASGDVEQLVAAKARDRSSPYRYLDIAQVYRAARKPNRALAWAERGLEAFADDPDPRLEDFAADAHHRCRRHDEATTLIRGQFRRRMDLDAYQHLKNHADRAKQWLAWRDRALAAIRESIDRSKQASADPRPYRRPVIVGRSQGRSPTDCEPTGRIATPHRNQRRLLDPVGLCGLTRAGRLGKLQTRWEEPGRESPAPGRSPSRASALPGRLDSVRWARKE